MSELVGGLGPNGKLILIGVAFDPIEVSPYTTHQGRQDYPRMGSG